MKKVLPLKKTLPNVIHLISSLLYGVHLLFLSQP